MAKRQAVALNESTPQLEAPQSGDTYQLVRDVFLTTGVIKSEVADGASAVGVTIDTENAFSTAGAKLLSIKNNGTEKAYFADDGSLIIGNTNNAKIDLLNGSGWTKARISQAKFLMASNYELQFGTASDADSYDAAWKRTGTNTVSLTDGSSGRGYLEFLFPTSDPGIAGVWWDNAGTLTRSAG